MYKILIDDRAWKELKRLHPEERKRVSKAIDSLSTNPRPKGKKIKPFHGILHGYRLRVGKVRILYVVDDEDKLVTITTIEHRGDIY